MAKEPGMGFWKTVDTAAKTMGDGGESKLPSTGKIARTPKNERPKKFKKLVPEKRALK